MASPAEKLAESLEVLKKLQDQGIIAIQAKDISRTHRQRLVKNGFLHEVIKGWYVSTKPDTLKGESTAWYSSYWEFCSAYLNKRFRNQWCLSPEQSLSLHVGNRTVPKQLLIRTPKGSNKITSLPYETSLLDVRYTMPNPKEISTLNGMRIFSLASALVYCGPKFFMQNPSDVRTALSLIRDSSEILEPLLTGGHSTIAGRLAGGFRNIGYDQIANDIIKTMSAAGFDIRETNPFQETQPVIISHRERSPYVKRLQILWQEMRSMVEKHFPVYDGKKKDAKSYLKEMEKIYVMDAYHSLSIEGYLVSAELIQRVRTGNWNPDKDDGDREQTAALAARGYWQAFQLVEKSIQKIFAGKNPGKVFEEDHRDWYREMFSPCVVAGILKPHDLAGYRNNQVYIRHSKHVPPNADAVRDLMPALCDLLYEEKSAAVRIVLGHFFFVYIHPYMDGNGRMGRFLMNIMLAAGNYPWVIIPVERRESYMQALEEASVKQNIVPFTKFLASLTAQD